MQRTPFSSGTILSVGYEAAMAIPELELASGDLFQFFHVPLTIYVELMQAGSKGDYYRYKIRPVYEHKKIKGRMSLNEK